MVLLLVAGSSVLHGARVGGENSPVLKDVSGGVGAQGSLKQQQQQQANIDRSKEFDDDLTGKRQRNDGAHFRLFYKSNTPERSISHQLEHRYFKNPNANNYYSNGAGPSQYFVNPNQYNNNGFALNNQFMWPVNRMVNNPMSFKPKSYLNPESKNRQTMLNIHYHGQNLEDLDGQWLNFDDRDLFL